MGVGKKKKEQNLKAKRSLLEGGKQKVILPSKRNLPIQVIEVGEEKQKRKSEWGEEEEVEFARLPLEGGEEGEEEVEGTVERTVEGCCSVFEKKEEKEKWDFEGILEEGYSRFEISDEEVEKQS